MANPNQVSNIPEFSVSELAFSLKRTLEDTYGRVRVRGELSKVKIHTSGHMYSTLKDEQSNIDAVCWRGTLGRLAVRPEEGLEVICTGKITTYPARSSYQLVIETMELAGEGALLKMLEERKKKLAAEGLFDPASKRQIPFLPGVIGVVTSPTGAVIRDIIHRIEDRFPRRILVWPVLVQGPGAAGQIAAAISGFDALPRGGPVPRPDVLIVARGGGSLEDLMPFNEEQVVRAAAGCSIPLISAVGHETDTTLIDFAADLRAPTPTGAAEKAVPVRLNLLAQVMEDGQRLMQGAARLLADLRNRLQARAAALRDPAAMLEIRIQRVDHLSHKLSAVFEKGLQQKTARAAQLGVLLRHPRNLIEEKGKLLDYHAAHLLRIAPRIPQEPARRLGEAARMLESLSFERVLDRGFAVVRDADGNVLSDAGALRPGQDIELQFRQRQTARASVRK